MELFGAVYCVLFFLSSSTQGSNVDLVEKASKFERRDVDTCVDNSLCATLPDICTNLDQALVKSLCPAKCGLCPTQVCSPSYCQNSGVCVMVLGSPKCACPDEVSGVHCETDTRDCPSNPCINGGTCSRGYSGTFSCSCASGFTGLLCETASILNIEQVTNAPAANPYPGCEDNSKVNCSDVKHQVCSFESAYLICPRTCNLCDRNPSYHPCKDHVQGLNCADRPDPCNDSVGLISCPLFCGVCSSPTTSPTTVRDNPLVTALLKTTPLPVTIPSSGPCGVSPCINGGTCFGKGFMFTCSCLSGYSGPFCNIEPSPPTTTIRTTPQPITTATTAAARMTTPGMCALNPCLNGGICSDTNGGFVCLCLPGFVHPVCSPEIQTTIATETTSTPVTLTTEVNPDKHLCSLRPCLNGGMCREINGGFMCLCPPGFVSPVCAPASTASLLTTVTTATPPTTMTPTITTTAAATTTTTTTANLCLMNMLELGCQPADVVFMIDISVRDNKNCSINHQGDFIKRVVTNRIKSSPGIHVGVVTYHDTAEQPIHLNDYQDLNGFKAAISNITGDINGNHVMVGGVQSNRHARLANAFDFVRTTSFKGHRQGVPKVVIPIIHTHMGRFWQRGLLGASQRLKDACVSIMPVVVLQTTNDLRGREVAHQIASSPSQDFYQEFNTFDDLEHGFNSYGSNCH